MLEISAIKKDIVRYTINSDLLELLEKFSIFQSRDSSDKQDKFNKRWKIGGAVVSHKSSEIEPYSVNGAGNVLYTAGSFCDIVSAFPLDAKIGRYCSVAGGLTTMGFRHPIEAAVMSCASFRWKREIMRAHSVKELGLKGETPSFNPVAIPQKTDPIEIGHDAWIGSNVVLSPGIKIGNGAVVAGNSVVVKNVAPYEIVGGNPAKHIKFRFPEEIRALMEQSRWWEHAPHIIHQFDMSEPGKFASMICNLKHELPVFQPLKLRLWDYTKSH